MGGGPGTRPWAAGGADVALTLGRPQLHYLRLPKDISDDHVILMDCTVSTGAAAMMAVRVLLVSGPGGGGAGRGRGERLHLVPGPSRQDHDVPEDKIFLLSLLMAEMGVHSVAYAFPRVRIITTAVDKRVNDLFRIIPGIGAVAWAEGGVGWGRPGGPPQGPASFSRELRRPLLRDRRCPRRQRRGGSSVRGLARRPAPPTRPPASWLCLQRTDVLLI